jgi:hypothetical protein
MPAWLIPLIMAAGAGLSAASSAKDRKTQQQLATDDRALTEAQDIRRTALAESQLDPFRAQAAQGKNLAALDFLQNYGRRTISPPSNVAPYTGSVGGAFQPSQTMRDYAGLLFKDVASGRTAPTMTNPANYGQTGVLDLVTSAATKQPTAATSAAAPVTNYALGLDRANEHGDLSIADARQVIRNAYEQELGRTPSDEEVSTHLQNIGWRPGHRYVGEAGLYAILNSIRGARQGAA